MAGQDPPTSVRDVPLFLTDVATGAGGAIHANSAAVQRRVSGLFAAAMAACQLNKAGGLKLLRVGGASHAAAAGASYDSVLALGGWLNDVASRHYRALDALSLMGAVWPAAGWRSSGGGGRAYHLHRAATPVPAAFVDALGAARLRAAQDELAALLQAERLPKPAQLYVSALRDILDTDLALLSVVCQDLPLQVRPEMHAWQPLAPAQK